MSITLGDTVDLDTFSSGLNGTIPGRAYDLGDGRIAYTWAGLDDNLAYVAVYDYSGVQQIAPFVIDGSTAPTTPGPLGFTQQVYSISAGVNGNFRVHYVLDEDRLFPPSGDRYYREFTETGAAVGGSVLVEEDGPLFTFDNTVSAVLSNGTIAVASDSGLTILDADGAYLSGATGGPGFFTSDNGFDIVETADGIMMLTAQRYVSFSPFGWQQSITVRNFDLDGTPVSGPTALTATEYAGTETSIVFATIDATVLEDGRVAVVYSSEEPAGNADDNEVFVLILNSDGTVNQGPFSGNPGQTAGAQFYPSVHALEDGGFVVLSETTDTAGGANIMVQRFTEGGVAFGDPVFSVTPFSQMQSIITSFGTGLIIGEAGFGQVISIDTSAQPPAVPTPGNDDLIGTDAADEVDLLEGNDRFEALDGDDSVFGNDGDDTILGGEGDDSLTGGAGDDWIDGGAGADFIDGGDGYDIVSYESATRSVRVDLQNPAFMYNDAVGDTFANVEAFQTGGTVDQLRGDAAANFFYTGGLSDRLYGRAGDDFLFGEAGADAFYGGTGADTMTGGDDADRRDRYIYFNIVESGVGDGNRDVITDFVSGEDRIEIRRFDADATTGGKQYFDFVGDAGLSGTAGELAYVQAGGNTVIQADVDGDGVADFEIELTGIMDLTAGDFLI